MSPKTPDRKPEKPLTPGERRAVAILTSVIWVPLMLLLLVPLLAYFGVMLWLLGPVGVIIVAIVTLIESKK